MAFCKYCGNEIPEGGVCGCPGAQAAAQGQNAAAQVNNTFDQANNVYGGQPDYGQPQNNGGFNPNELVDKAKKNPVILIGACAGVVVLILLLVFVLGHTGAKGAAKKYANAFAKKGKAKTYFSMTLPKDKISDLKDDDKWDDMVEALNDKKSDRYDDGIRIKIKSVKKGKKLSKTALKGAEAVWKSKGADDPEAKKGYEFKIKVQTKDEDGDKDTDTQKICVVKFKGEGWKVIETSQDALKARGEADDDDDDDYDDYYDFDYDEEDFEDFDW